MGYAVSLKRANESVQDRRGTNHNFICAMVLAGAAFPPHNHRRHPSDVKAPQFSPVATVEPHLRVLGVCVCVCARGLSQLPCGARMSAITRKMKKRSGRRVRTPVVFPEIFTLFPHFRAHARAGVSSLPRERNFISAHRSRLYLHARGEYFVRPSPMRFVNYT